MIRNSSQRHMSRLQSTNACLILPPKMLSSPLRYLSPPRSLIFKFNTKPPFQSPPFLHHNHLKTISKSYTCTPCPCSNLDSIHSIDDSFDVELGRLLALLPEDMRRRVNEHPELHQLIEVVMDLGRKPLARYPSGDFVLSDHPITMDDIKHATSLVGDFAIDNRAGISRTLHRISAIRNRKGAIIGLTCRVGRAVSGSASLLRDLVKDGASLLLIGPPGVGKTTIIRDIARMLANDNNKRVMIVDTSNEIGGDGDIPHAGIGYARRMQVPNSDVQHKVLIEAVENHMPQVIVIDEIGTKLEAAAASTIAQRGIQLVATAHGITIENLVMNPSLEMLVGGIQSVTLGDEEASRRGVQKSVLERKGPSTFSCGVEIISKFELRVHRSLEATVDSILAGHVPKFEVRKLHKKLEDGTVESNQFLHDCFDKKMEMMADDSLPISDERSTSVQFFTEKSQSNEPNSFGDMPPLQLFLYGIPAATALQGFKHLNMENAVEFTENISDADALLVLLSKIKKNARIQAAAKSHGIPIYVTKTSSLPQLTKAIEALVSDYDDGFEDFKAEANLNDSEKADALEEARIAIERVVIPNGEPVELLPRAPNIILLQKDLIRKYKLRAERVGTTADERLRILPLESKMSKDERDSSEGVDVDNEAEELFSFNDKTNGSPYTVDKLPLRPDWA